MFHNSLGLYFLFRHEHFKTMFFEAFPMFRYYSCKYLLISTLQEANESKVNFVKDFLSK